MKTALKLIRTTALATAALLGGCITALTDGLPEGSSPPRLESEVWLNADVDAGTPPGETAGGPVLIEFWSKDCPPCRENIPHMARIDRGYADRGLAVVSVHLGLNEEDRTQDVAAVREFVEAAGITYPVGIDQTGASWERFDFGYLPHALLVGADGRVLWSGNLYVHDIEEKVAEHFGPPRQDALAEAGIPLQELDAAADEACEDGVCAPR